MGTICVNVSLPIYMGDFAYDSKESLKRLVAARLWCRRLLGIHLIYDSQTKNYLKMIYALIIFSCTYIMVRTPAKSTIYQCSDTHRSRTLTWRGGHPNQRIDHVDMLDTQADINKSVVSTPFYYIHILKTTLRSFISYIVHVWNLSLTQEKRIRM